MTTRARAVISIRDYRDMRALFAMSEAKHNMILCGPSNSGIGEPAHATAIALSQITATFIFTYADDESCPIDYTDSIIYGKLLSRLVDEIGMVFLALVKELHDIVPHSDLTPDKIH